MSWFGKGEPSLTVSARKLSAIVDGLDEEGQRQAIQTVRSLIQGIRGMSALPAGVAGELWSMFITFGRKALMAGMGGDEAKASAASEQCMAEVRDGLSSGLVSMIETEARR